MIYKLHPPRKNPFLEKIDNEKRQKVEEALNKKLSDFEWSEYKRMTLPRSRYQK